ncbi:carboxylesterase/lipase family protein [Microbacterium hominis]|uniref:Carboxylic ester hydrolase n=1 Tax=Microbacterium hominis TaxID=162426 RepID=A0A7D4U6X1_9MICO|nr:carboxylesterase family protein [Microbacterium hominis]QKJ18726.1 carboxylesterase/lipase family protein [Microbacterium hominis]
MTSTTPSVDVEVSVGALRGITTDGIHRFLGIPYAQPPIGDLRFAAPQPREAWEGVREATAFGPAAPQTAYPGEIGELLPSVDGWGEDMLTVNVWAPADATAAPVVLWLHGGALERGSASLSGYDGSTFARDGIVFASINYRLGSEGFSVLDGAPLNLGLRDAALALEWVHREIAAFGGDPSRITLMGESAGGALVAALLSRPESARLVAGGIIESGPLEAVAPAKAAAVTRGLAASLGVPATAAAFREVAPERLLQARTDQAKGRSALSGAPSFQLALDPDFLPRSPHEALAEGDVPLLIGTNTDEYRLWFPPAALDAISPVKALLARAALRLPRRAVAAARADAPDASPGEVLGQLLTDRLLRAPLTAVASSRPATTYVFEFAWQSPVRDLRAAHAVELGFVFDNVGERASVSLSGPEAPQELATEMHRAWVSFITDADPGWEPFGAQRLTRIFDTGTRTEPQRRTGVVDALA